MIKVNCVNCNKVIYKYPYEVKRSKKGAFFCSKKCHSSYSSKVEVKCGYCNKNIRIWPHVYNKSKNKIFFCSKKCHYTYGNPSIRGIPRSKDVKKKISIANKGRKMSPEFRKKMSKIGKTKIGPLSNSYGKKASEETRRKLSESHKGYIMPESQKKKISKSNEGKKWKKTQIMAMSGENSHLWKGGISKEGYPIEFNKIKPVIRKRDNYQCQECFKHQKYLFDSNGKKYRLHVHHIDYNKMNNNKSNLISLCHSCHTKTNFRREDWEKYFKNKLGDENQ